MDSLIIALKSSDVTFRCYNWRGVAEASLVVGIVSAKLSARAAPAGSGALLENVNCAIKSGFLLEIQTLSRAPTRRARDIPKKSRPASHGTALLGLRGLIESAQVSKDFPQPQLCFAFGLEILKPPAVRASLKSTTVPRRYCALTESTKTSTPFCSEARSPSRFASKTMPYCIPEQPPCSTKIRSVLPAFSGNASSDLTSAAAFPVTLTTGSIE